MKKLTSIFIISILLTCVVFAQEIISPKSNTVIAPSNHSFLTEEAVGSTIEVKGLLSVKNNSFVLKENPESRSVVTFHLEVKKWGLKRKLKKLNGQTVKITGELLDASSTWTKKMKVLSVE